MKMFLILAVAALTLSVPIAWAVQAQTDDARSRGLVVKFQDGTIDGMQVSVLKKSGDGMVPVLPNTAFKEGDEIWVSFASNFDGYVYIVNVKPDGQKRVLFPYQTAADKQTSNLVRADQRYILPKGDAFAFDDQPGTETLQVIMSRDPVPFLDAAVKNPNGDLGDSASSAAAELQGKASKKADQSVKRSDDGGIVTDDVAIVVPRNGPDDARTRDIRRVSLAQPPAGARVRNEASARAQNQASTQTQASAKTPVRVKHRVDKQGSVVAIPDEPGKGGKLRPGDLAVFEIRLKHV